MQYSLNYAADGFHVFPVYEPIGVGQCSCGKTGCKGKHPRTPNGCLDATTDAQTIKDWWTKWPSASIGIATGKRSGLAVIDLDGLAGLMSGKKLRLSSPITALTGNGQQLFYSDPEGELSNSVKKLAPGIDTRGEGGYVVVAPSLHPNGKRYAWQGRPLSRNALSPLPNTLVQADVAQPVSTVRKPDGWIADALALMRGGHVANTLVSVVGKFRYHNFSEADTVALLRPYALVDGRPFEGLDAKVHELFTRYEASPREEAAVVTSGKTEAVGAFLKDVKEPEWVCKPIISKSSIVFFVGLPKTLKTWLLVDLAVECARGGGLWLGQFPVATGKVLFIDQERGKMESQRRFKAVIAAKGIEPSTLDGRLSIKCGTTIKLDDERSYEAFRAELSISRPDVLIIDSFATFHTKPEQDRTEIQKVLERVKAIRNDIGCSIIFVHHENKRSYQDMEEGKLPTINSMSGSTAIPAAAESVVIVRKIEEGLSMVHHVASTVGEASKSFTVSLADTADGGITVRGQL